MTEERKPCGEFHPLPCGLDVDCPETEDAEDRYDPSETRQNFYRLRTAQDAIGGVIESDVFESYLKGQLGAALMIIHKHENVLRARLEEADEADLDDQDERCPECDSDRLVGTGYSRECLDCGWAGDYPAVVQ